MRAQLNFAEGAMDERSAKMFGYLVGHAAQVGGTITLSETPQGGHVVGYHFGEETPGSEMAAGAAYGMGESLAEALAGVLDDLGVKPEEVGL